MQIQKIFELKNELLRRKSKDNLLAFAKYTKRDYSINWHHQVLANKLEDWISGKSSRLMVFMPPRRGKTELANVRLVPYIIGKNPNKEVISCSYSASIAGKMSAEIQKVIDNQLYQDIFPYVRLPRATDRGSKRTSDFFNVMFNDTSGGSYRAAGVGGGISGMGFDFGIIDDPFKNREEAYSLIYRDKVFDWYNSTFRTRMSPNARILIIMTRWHEDDLAGRLLKLSKDDVSADAWDTISFEEIKESDNKYDNRGVGEVLWHSRYPLSESLKTKSSIGTVLWESLYQQRPSSAGGNIIKRAWFRYFDKCDLTKVIISVDCTFKGSDTSDYVAAQVWATDGTNYYLLNQIRKRASFIDTQTIIRTLVNQYPRYHSIVIEDKANGTAIIEVLSKTFSRIIPFNPKSSKEERLFSVTPLFEAGNIFIPKESNVGWVGNYISELCSFPSAPNDDQVDATSQALIFWESKKHQGYQDIDRSGSIIIKSNDY